jgi:hypothetical protein
MQAHRKDTFDPARAKPSAIARPRPRPPPVIIAVLPESSPLAIFPFSVNP